MTPKGVCVGKIGISQPHQNKGHWAWMLYRCRVLVNFAASHMTAPHWETETMKKFLAGCFLVSIPIGICVVLYVGGGLGALVFFWILIVGLIGVAFAAIWAAATLWGD